MYETRQFRKGLKVELEGVPYQIVDFQHVSPGKVSAFTRTKLRNLLNSNVTEKTFKSGEKVPRANVNQRDMQYLYHDADGYHFMDNGTYEQIVLTEEFLGTEAGFLKENVTCSVLLYNERPIGVELPTFVELTVADTEPSFKGDTVSGGGKPAKMESGATVTVPFHIQEGDVIKVDTRDGSYAEKVNK